MTGLVAAPAAANLSLQALSLLRRFWPTLPILALAIALLITRDRLADTRTRLAAEIRFGDGAHAATREASANPTLARSETAEQIVALGHSLAATRTGLAVCTDTAKAAAERDRERQRTFEARLHAFEQAEPATRATIDRLRSSAANARPPGATCEASATLKEIWR